MNLKRLLHQTLARMAAHWPRLSDRLVAGFTPRKMNGIPWTPVRKAIVHSKVALVTTAGVHHGHQQPFNMTDVDGDPSFRIIDRDTIESDYMITHDYYDHRHADQDLNIVFPLSHLMAMQQAGCIGQVADRHYAFMGHIDGRQVDTLVEHIAPQVARLLEKDGVDMVLLTPA